MSDRVSSMSLLRRVDSRLLTGGLLGSVLLYVARQHAMAAAGLLVFALVAGVLHWQMKQRAIVAAPLHTEAAAIALEPQDEVTGLFGRATLESRLAEEWRRDRLTMEPTALMLIRLDKPEEAGRTMPEPDGDLAERVLMLTLARALGRMLPRKADLLAQYDHRTFAALLPGTDLPGALRVAARLRFTIARLGIADPAADSGLLTVSTGLAVQLGVPAEVSAGLMTATEQALDTAVGKGPDGLDYTVLEGRDEAGALPRLLALPTIPAWSPALETAASQH